MHFELLEEHRLLQDLVARFVRENLIPLEQKVLERDASGQGAYLSHEERDRIDAVSREMGLWGLDAPEDVGGADLAAVAPVFGQFSALAMMRALVVLPTTRAPVNR